MLYNKFSDYLKTKYHGKVYKLPVNIPTTCPNRDGSIGSAGCIFCGEEGAGFENLCNTISVREQLKTNAEYIGNKYNVNKFIAYFQNFSNTYMPLDKFKEYIKQAYAPNIVAVYISTRPDCINDRYLDFLKVTSLKENVDIVIELGLQTVNYHTLKVLNRGHLLAEYIDAMNRINRFELGSCTHYIIDLPMDCIDDVIEGAKVISALGTGQVKCHSMFVLDDTVLGSMFKEKKIIPIDMDQFIERCITFLEYLNPQIVVQRLLGRAPEERSLFCNWGKSWWKIRDLIEEKMIEENRYQGKNFNYLNGSALKQFKAME